MPAKAPPIVDLEEEVDSINMLVFGESGCGKTVFGALAPKETLLLSTERGGTVSARRHGGTAKVNHIKVWEDLQQTLDWLKERHRGYKWIVIDTVTQMQTLLVQYILRRAVEDNEERNPDIPSLQDHQEWQNKFKRFMDEFNALDSNVLWLAHSMLVEEEDGEERHWPALQGGKTWITIAQGMCAKMSVVGYMRTVTPKVRPGETAKEIRRIRFRPTTEAFAKDRSDALGVFQDDTTLTKISDLLEKGLNKKPATPVAPTGRRGRRRGAAA